MPAPPAPARAPAPPWRRTWLLALACAGLLLCGVAQAVETMAWARLSPAQQQALDPLQAEWASLSPERQAKWLEVASRFPTMSAAERQRLHARMAEWVRMTPEQRRRARLHFQEARRVSPEDREAAWKAYQALPEAERQRLAEQRARPVARPATSASAPKAKSNVVQSAPVAPRRAAATALQQARSGATTSPMNQTPLPPATIQHGLPKIAATPGFVDPATLLPRRGPQGAAVVRSAPPASAPRP